ncbi:AAA family ATPase [Pollutimonas harenae]|uniref:AAA family ATPase n=1 Tax=Pollutimonas harenae TaxID=657015 RepID=A0A853H3I6_9BURK|nr:AAA family ATPase [Pollutimonas harenae]NYT85123.1 AAA family ATPase [Pollutimonas harenae]TEA72495.1 hypothetical protein ERD84_00860 [Pollutimonas harenae]
MHPSLTRPIQLRLLGEFDVAVNDISATRRISYTKPRLLLAILAISQGKPIARSNLANMLWPASQQDSRANLRHALFVLRRLFESVPDIWLPSRHTLALNPDVIMVDALAITGGYRDLNYRDRLDYDRGSLLEHMELPDSSAFTTWHNNWQARIERDIAECRERLIGQLMDQEEHEQAVRHAKRWVQQHPADESTHRHLIRLLRDTGNDEAALLALEHCRQMLREHHNQEDPSEQTLALLHRATPTVTATASKPDPAYALVPTREYRPLALLGVAIMLDTVDVERDNPLQDLQVATDRIRSRAEAAGGQVQPGLDGSLLIIFGFPALAERPAHLCARLACALRESVLPDGIYMGMGIHADVAMMHSSDLAKIVRPLSQHAMKLAYLAEPHEILLTASTRDRIVGQFAVHYETRYDHELYVLDAQRDVRPVERMFGRMREFDTLVRFWARLPKAQTPTSMVVRGGPGVGKSLLVNVMAEYVRRTGGDIRKLYSEEGYEAKPFHPVRSHFAAEPSSAVSIEAHQNTRAGMMETLISALLQRSRPDTSLLIIWEDLHWADPSSIALITALLQRTQAAPTLVLMSTRNEFEIPDSWNELQLMPLDRRAMAELVVHRSRSHHLTAPQRDQIVEQADGIPLFAEEIVRQVALGAEIGTTPVILDLIAARISALSPAARQLAQFAAVAGNIDDSLLTHASQKLDVNPRQVHTLMTQLRQHGLVEDGMPTRFCHDLTRVAVYQTMDPVQRKQQHANVAQFLIHRDAQQAQAQAVCIAQHLDASRHPDACHWWCVAGRDALAQAATSEAQTMADRALDALERIPDERRRRKAEFECQLLRGSILTLLKGGGASETSQAYERVVELHRKDDDPDMQFQMQWGEWVVAFNTQAHAIALGLAENLMQHAEQRNSDIVLGSAQYAVGQTRLFMGDAARAERWLRTALHTLGRRAVAGHHMTAWGTETAHSARGMLAWVLALQGRDDEGIRIAQEGLAGRDESVQMPSRILCQAVLCELYRLQGDVDSTQAAARTLKSTTQDTSLVFWRALADGMMGWTAAHRGDQRGLHAIEHAVQVASRAMPVWQSPLELLLADSRSSLGQTELALESIERAGSLIEHYGTHLIRGAYLCQRGTALAATGQSNGAISCWQQGIVESRRLGLSVYARRAEIQLNAHLHAA